MPIQSWQSEDVRCETPSSTWLLQSLSLQFKFFAYSIDEVFGNGWNLWGLDWKLDQRRRGGIDANRIAGIWKMKNIEWRMKNGEFLIHY
jgi:hypothetical protein